MGGRRRRALLLGLLAGALLPSQLAHAKPREPVTAWDVEPAEDGVTEARGYWFHQPAKLANEHERALVVVLHGCAQHAVDAMEGMPWNHLADERGFVVVYPEQERASVDGNGAGCWNSGQAPVYERGLHELETLARITRRIRDRYSIAPGRVFILGISSGAQMSAAMAATYPDLYAALGSVVGCGYPCGDPTGVAAWNRMGTYSQRVPGFFVAGTADYLINPAMSQGGVQGWAMANDLADDGDANESVSHTPVVQEPIAGGTGPGHPQGQYTLCIQSWNNPCPADAAGWSDYPTTISRYYAGDAVIVESWVLHGMSHNYPGGDATAGTFTDPHGPDITTAMYDFFLAHARG